MRSHDTNSSNNRIRSRLPLALTAIVAIFALATTADAAQRLRSWPGGKVTPIGVAGGVPGITGNPGGKPGTGGANTSGGRVLGYHNDRPLRPRWKPPIIVAVPSAVTAVTAVAAGNVNPQLNKGAGGGSRTGPQIAPRSYSGLPPVGERRYVPDEVLIQLASSVPDAAIDALARRMRLTRVESFTSNGITMFRWKISDGRSVPEVIRSLQGLVLAAQPNYLYQLQEQPVPQQSEATADTKGDHWQYALAKLRLPQAHELARGEQVLIAVIDSGVDTTHPELEGMVVDSFDALDSNEKPHPHGTAIAGAIVAHSRLMGAAPEARILAARAFSAKARTAEATTYSINRGIDWAMSRGARIINMSFSGPRDPSIEQRLLQARKQGIVLIAAAGNGGSKAPDAYPAAYPNVIAVTATDADDHLFLGANRGRYIAVAAPGVELLLPAPEATYQVATGTSFAAAEVSGIVALMLERKPDLGHDGVRKTLIATARDLGPKGFDIQFGAGLVDAYQAVRSLAPAVATTGARVTPAANRQ